MGTLQPWIDARRCAGPAAGTTNHDLQLVRRILKLAAGRWRDDQGLTWLETAPEIVFLPNRYKRPAWPLTWDEEEWLLAELPPH